MKTTFTTIVDGILEYEWVILLLIAVPMLFPKPEWTLSLLVVPGLWILRWIRDGQPLLSTPLNLPILVLSLMLLVSLWATYSIEFSLPKISGLIFAVGVYFVTYRVGSKSILKTMMFFLLCGLAISALGLVATDWPTKIPILNDLIERFPQVISRLPAAEAGIHPNELGGILLLFAPLSLWVAWRSSWRGGENNRLKVILFWMIALWFCGLLFLTQSRSALLGFAAAVGIFLILSGRLGRQILTVGAIALVLLVVVLRPASFLGVTGLESSGASMLGDVGFSARIEIWSRAILGIEHYAYTGMGLGTFREVIPRLYPFFLIAPERDIAHAHSLFLQTGQDFGIPGIVAFTSIWAVLFGMLYRGLKFKINDPFIIGLTHQDLIGGLLGGILAFFVFSLTDAVALGARPGFLMWMTFGLITALYQRINQSELVRRTLSSEVRTEQLPGLLSEA